MWQSKKLARILYCLLRLEVIAFWGTSVWADFHMILNNHPLKIFWPWLSHPEALSLFPSYFRNAVWWKPIPTGQAHTQARELTENLFLESSLILEVKKRTPRQLHHCHPSTGSSVSRGGRFRTSEPTTATQRWTRESWRKKQRISQSESWGGKRRNYSLECYWTRFSLALDTGRDY